MCLGLGRAQESPGIEGKAPIWGYRIPLPHLLLQLSSARGSFGPTQCCLQDLVPPSWPQPHPACL